MGSMLARIYPPPPLRRCGLGSVVSFPAEYRKRRLNQARFVLRYFALFVFVLYLVRVFFCTVLFVSISQVIGCEDRLRNGLQVDYVWWGVKRFALWDGGGRGVNAKWLLRQKPERTATACVSARWAGYDHLVFSTGPNSELRRRLIMSQMLGSRVVATTVLFRTKSFQRMLRIDRWYLRWRDSSFHMSSWSKVHVSEPHSRIEKIQLWHRSSLL